MALRRALTLFLCLAVLARTGMVFAQVLAPAAAAGADAFAEAVAAAPTDCHGDPLPVPQAPEDAPATWSCLDCGCGCLAAALPAAAFAGDPATPDTDSARGPPGGHDQTGTAPGIRPPIAA